VASAVRALQVLIFFLQVRYDIKSSLDEFEAPELLP
jgi:hypothetical protein